MNLHFLTHIWLKTHIDMKFSNRTRKSTMISFRTRTNIQKWINYKYTKWHTCRHRINYAKIIFYKSSLMQFYLKLFFILLQFNCIDHSDINNLLWNLYQPPHPPTPPHRVHTRSCQQHCDKTYALPLSQLIPSKISQNNWKMWRKHCNQPPNQQQITTTGNPLK